MRKARSLISSNTEKDTEKEMVHSDAEPEESKTSDSRLADKIWSLAMQNHPSWNILTNLVEKCMSNESQITSIPAVTRNKCNIVDKDKFLRRYKKYKNNCKKYKNKLRLLENTVKCKDSVIQ